jgi:uncharacterized iron-regulated protein
MRSPLSTWLSVWFFALLAGCATHQEHLNVESPYRDLYALEKGQILHVATGRLVSEPQLLEYLYGYRVVYIGETHDSLDDHAVQLALFKGLHQRSPRNLALGLEMLPRDAQADMDAFIRREMDEDGFRRVWTLHWGHTFPYYEEILGYARRHGIRVLALNTAENLKKAIREKPLDQLAPDLADRLPEMDMDDPYHRAATRAVFEAHRMGPRDTEAFYRVQVLWDETMAQTAAEYLQSPEGKGSQLVILAGGHHIRYGYGIPRRLFRRVPLPFVIVLPLAVEIPENKQDRMMDVEAPSLPMPPGDFLWAVGYTDLEDLKEAPAP